MTIFQKQYIKTPIVVLVIASLLLQFVPSREPAQAGTGALRFIIEVFRALKMPDEIILDEDGSLRVGDLLCISGDDVSCFLPCFSKSACECVQWGISATLPEQDYILEVVEAALGGIYKRDGKYVYGIEKLDYSREAWRKYWESLASMIMSPAWVQSMIKNTKGAMKYRHARMMEACINGAAGLDTLGRAIAADVGIDIKKIENVPSLQWLRGIETECGSWIGVLGWGDCDMTDPNMALDGPRAWVEWRVKEYRKAPDAIDPPFVLTGEIENLTPPCIKWKCDCANPFSHIDLGPDTRTKILSDTGRLLKPKIESPSECELGIPPKPQDDPLTEEQHKAQQIACTHLRRLQQAASEEVILAKRMYNNTDPFTECNFLRNCKSSCALRLGELSYTISVVDIAIALVPGGFVTIIQKILNIFKIINEVKKIWDSFKLLTEQGIGFVNNLLNITQSVNNYFQSFNNLGLSFSEALLFGAGTIALSELGGEIGKTYGPKGQDIGQAIGGVVGAAGALAVTKESKNLSDLLVNYSVNMEKFGIAKAEALNLQSQLAGSIETVRTHFKREPEIDFLFDPNLQKKKDLEKIIEDYFLVFESIDAFLGEIVEAGTLSDGGLVTERTAGEGWDDWCDNTAREMELKSERDEIELEIRRLKLSDIELLPPGNLLRDYYDDLKERKNKIEELLQGLKNCTNILFERKGKYFCSKPPLSKPAQLLFDDTFDWCVSGGGSWEQCHILGRVIPHSFCLDDPTQFSNASECDWLGAFKNVFKQTKEMEEFLDPEYILGVVDRALGGPGREPNTYAMKKLNDTKGAWTAYWRLVAGMLGVSISGRNHAAIMNECVDVFKPLERIAEIETRGGDMTDPDNKKDDGGPRPWVKRKTEDYGGERDDTGLPQLAELTKDDIKEIQEAIDVLSDYAAWISNTQEVITRISTPVAKRADECIKWQGGECVNDGREFWPRGNKYWKDVKWCYNTVWSGGPTGLLTYITHYFKQSYDSDIAYQNWDDRIEIIKKASGSFDELKAALEMGLSPQEPLIVYHIEQAKQELDELTQGKTLVTGEIQTLVDEVIDKKVKDMDCSQYKDGCSNFIDCCKCRVEADPKDRCTYAGLPAVNTTCCGIGKRCDDGYEDAQEMYDCYNDGDGTGVCAGITSCQQCENDCVSNRCDEPVDEYCYEDKTDDDLWCYEKDRDETAEEKCQRKRQSWCVDKGHECGECYEHSTDSCYADHEGQQHCYNSRDTCQTRCKTDRCFNNGDRPCYWKEYYKNQKECFWEHSKPKIGDVPAAYYFKGIYSDYLVCKQREESLKSLCCQFGKSGCDEKIPACGEAFEYASCTACKCKGGLNTFLQESPIFESIRTKLDEKLIPLFRELQAIWEPSESSLYESVVAKDYVNKIIESKRISKEIVEVASALEGEFTLLQQIKTDIEMIIDAINVPQSTKDEIKYGKNRDGTGIIAKLESTLIIMGDKILNTIREKIGDSYVCNINKSGFLHKIKCFEMDNHKTFEELIPFLDVLKNFEVAAENVSLVGRNIGVLEPEIKMAALQINTGIVEAGETAITDCLKSWLPWREDKKCDITKPFTQLFEGQAKDEENWEYTKANIVSDPLSFLDDTFTAIGNGIDWTKNTYLEEAKTGINNRDVLGGDARRNAYNEAITGMQEDLTTLWWDRVGSDVEEADRNALKFACQAASMILDSNPGDIQENCDNRDCEKNKDKCLLNNQRLEDTCQLLGKIDPDLLEDPQGIGKALSFLEDRRACIMVEWCSDGSRPCLVCPKWFCLNELGEWAVSKKDPLDPTHGDSFCKSTLDSKGNDIPGDNLLLKGGIVWDTTVHGPSVPPANPTREICQDLEFSFPCSKAKVNERCQLVQPVDCELFNSCSPEELQRQLDIQKWRQQSRDNQCPKWFCLNNLGNWQMAAGVSIDPYCLAHCGVNEKPDDGMFCTVNTGIIWDTSTHPTTGDQVWPPEGVSDVRASGMVKKCIEAQKGLQDLGALDPGPVDQTQVDCSPLRPILPFCQHKITCDKMQQGCLAWDVQVKSQPAGPSAKPAMEWPPTTKCPGDTGFAQKYSGAKDSCIQTQKSKRDLENFRENIKNLTGIDLTEVADMPAEAEKEQKEAEKEQKLAIIKQKIDGETAVCNELDYQKGVEKDCGEFEELKDAFKCLRGWGWCNSDVENVANKLKTFCNFDVEKKFNCDGKNKIKVDFTFTDPDHPTSSEAIAAEEARGAARKICRTKLNDIRTPLRELMKVWSIIMGIQSGTAAYGGLKNVASQAKGVYKQAQALYTMIENFGNTFSTLWGSDDETSQAAEKVAEALKSGFAISPPMCESRPAISYIDGKKMTGPQGGPVCPDVAVFYSSLNSQFSQIRQHWRTIDLSRRPLKVKEWQIGALKIDFDKLPDSDKKLEEAVGFIYNRATAIKEKAQYLWAAANAVNLAAQNCTCGQSVCDITIKKVPFCVSGLPLTIAPLKDPYCYLVNMFRWPLLVLAESLAQELAKPWPIR